MKKMEAFVVSVERRLQRQKYQSFRHIESSGLSEKQYVKHQYVTPINFTHQSLFTGLGEEAACNRLIALIDITKWLSCIVGDVGTRQSTDLAYDTVGLTVDSLKTKDQNQGEPAISPFIFSMHSSSVF